jgi:uncharacterized protein YvpB
MSARTAQRRSRQLFPWLAAGILAVAISSCLALIVWTWLQEDEIKSLRSSLEAQQREQDALEASLVALEGTAAVLEERLTDLATGAQATGGSTWAESDTAGGDQHQEIEELRAALSEIRPEVSDLRMEVSDIRSDLSVVMDSVDSPTTTTETPAQPVPPTARLTVARQKQSHNLSCESSAASMVAQYHGLQLSEEEVLTSLPVNSNPHLGFRGNVDGPTGGIDDYGVYAQPILEILNARGLRAGLVDGGIEDIKAAIARGNPVIAWVTYNCLPSTPTTKVIDGQEVTLVPNQHVVVVTGFSAEGVWANDPWDGQEDFYETRDFERAMSYFGEMAIEIAAP